jgi:hypothetical protein
MEKTLCLLAMLMSAPVFGQGVGINSSGANPDASSMLDIVASDKGVLIPRVALTATNLAGPITSPTTSLIVFNSATAGTAPNNVTPGYYYWDGSKWVRIVDSDDVSDDWKLLGNAGTAPGTNFLGTTDNVDLVFRTNNAEVVRFTSAGRVGIGTTIPSQSITSIDASTFTLAGNATGVDNLYLEDHSEGSGLDNIGGSISFSGPANGGGGAQRRHAAIAGIQTNGSESDHVGLSFYTHNSSVSTGNMQESMRITHDGNVGIGTTTPTAILHVNDLTNSVTISRLLFDGFEDGTLAPFTTGGTGWFTTNAAGNQNSGAYGASSGAITHNQSSSVSFNATLTADGTISFAYNVSSEACCDHLEFYIDGVLQNDWGGTTGWVNESFPVTAGAHTFTWTYDKDGSVSTGSDRALIDDIAITNVDQATNVAMRIVDGNQGAGKVLTGDANGYAFWEDPNNVIASPDDADWFVSPGSSVPEDINDVIYHLGTVVVGSNGDDGHHFDVDNGAATGTEIGIGSIEFITDGSSETTINNRFSPATDNSFDLGSATLRWDDVYATNGTIVTSDEREKENIVPMSYGLEEIMKLRPVTYKWKNDKKGSTILSEEDKELKLGLIAQEVQLVLPEVVQTHDWRILSEEEPDVYSRVPMERLGMSYHEIIPVLIKGTQEQQEIIIDQEEKLELLEQQLEELEQELKELKKLLSEEK